MTIHLITPEEHKTLEDIFHNYPALTLQNKAYEYINRHNLTDEDKSKIEEVSAILQKAVVGFSKFNNFRVTKNGEIEIRLQYHYNSSFTGVGYLLLDELLNGFNTENNY